MRTATMLAAMLALMLSACGSGLKGTFEDEMGMSTLTFHGGGKAVQSSSLAGIELEMRYELDGDQVRLVNPDVPGATLVFTRIDDDTLSGPMGIRFKRKD